MQQISKLYKNKKNPHFKMTSLNLDDGRFQYTRSYIKEIKYYKKIQMLKRGKKHFNKCLN